MQYTYWYFCNHAILSQLTHTLVIHALLFSRKQGVVVILKICTLSTSNNKHLVFTGNDWCHWQQRGGILLVGWWSALCIVTRVSCTASHFSLLEDPSYQGWTPLHIPSDPFVKWAYLLMIDDRHNIYLKVEINWHLTSENTACHSKLKSDVCLLMKLKQLIVSCKFGVDWGCSLGTVIAGYHICKNIFLVQAILFHHSIILLRLSFARSIHKLQAVIGCLFLKHLYLSCS